MNQDKEITVKKNVYTIAVRDIDGPDPLLDAAAMQLMCGHDIRELDTGAQIPAEWVRDMKRRHREAAAHTGTTDLVEFLEYWARKEHGAELVIVRQ